MTSADGEIETLTESMELIDRLQSQFKGGCFEGPGATALFNAYECLSGAKIHLRRQRAELEKERLLASALRRAR